MKLDPQLLDAQERAALRLRRLYQEAGYQRSRLSRFEPYELYANNKDVLLTEALLTFTEPGGRLMALRPDVTLSLIRAHQPGRVERVQYSEAVYRQRGQGQDFREIMQAGIECMGPIGQAECQEVLVLAARSLEALGGPTVLGLSHRGLIALALTGLHPGIRQQLMRLISQKNQADLSALLAEQAVDGPKRRQLMLLGSQSGPPGEMLPALRAAGFLGDALAELSAACQALEEAGFGKGLRIDFSLNADSRYYEGILFKGFLEGLPEGVLAGGRYDPLMKRLHKPAGGIGFAVYLDQLPDGGGEG